MAIDRREFLKSVAIPAGAGIAAGCAGAKGTNGVLRSYPKLDIFMEGPDEWPTGGGGHKFDDEKTEEIRRTYMHPLYKQAGELSRKVGGHGGMDYLMDLRWAYCLQFGLPLDTDVYDIASWCAVNELSERSARNRAETVDFPDFTRGAWKTAANCNLMDATIDMSKLDFRNVKAAERQMNV